jgi:hypothetical protein
MLISRYCFGLRAICPMYELITLAIAIVRGSFVTRTTLALLLYTVRMLAGSIILQVALTTLVAFVTQSCN